MPKYGERTRKTCILNRFEDYLEDMDCHLCEYWRGTRGCSRAVCRCEHKYADAVANGRDWHLKDRDKRSRKK